MKKVEIPFMEEMARQACKGKKTMTTRSKRYGEPGDVFEITNPDTGITQGFVLTHITPVRLKIVATNFYADEGFKTPEAFIATWKQLHPIKGWEPEAEKFAHEFKRVRE